MDFLSQAELEKAGLWLSEGFLEKLLLGIAAKGGGGVSIYKNVQSTQSVATH